MEIAIRFTTLMDILEFKEFLEPITSKYIIGIEHVDTNRHFQVYAKLNYEETSKLDKIRYKFKKRFNPIKSNYYIKKMKNDNLKTYCTKEDNFIYKGFNQDEIYEIRNRAYVKEKNTYIDYKRYLEQMYMADKIDEGEIIDQLVDYFQESHKDYDEYMITKFMNRLIQLKHPEYREKFKDNLKTKFKNIALEYNNHYAYVSSLPQGI